MKYRATVTDVDTKVMLVDTVVEIANIEKVKLNDFIDTISFTLNPGQEVDIQFEPLS
jgi:hypothetical protein